jgi:hypothetical protein
VSKEAPIPATVATTSLVIKKNGFFMKLCP